MVRIDQTAGVDASVEKAEIAAAGNESALRKWVRRGTAVALAGVAALGMKAEPAHAQSADTPSPFDVASNEAKPNPDPFALPSEPKPSLTSIAATTAGERISEELSAEDQAAIDAFDNFLETGIISEPMKAQIRVMKDRYEAGHFDKDPKTKSMVNDMITNFSLLAVL